MNKTIEQSVAQAMDASTVEILPFLPYILQDFWEIGASPSDISHLVRKHVPAGRAFKVLDLGCGKGAVSVKLAAEFGCFCTGIDAVGEFINYAGAKAAEYGVSGLCDFRVDDIRTAVEDFKGYDVIVLGAIGPVFGNAFETLEKVKGCLAADGVVLIDDAYYEDGAERDDTGIAYRSELLDQIGRAGMELADEKLADGNESRSDSFGIEFGHIVRRCSELADKFPDKKCIFEEYVETQRAEYDSIMNDLTCSTLVIKLRHPAL